MTFVCRCAFKHPFIHSFITTYLTAKKHYMWANKIAIIYQMILSI